MPLVSIDKEIEVTYEPTANMVCWSNVGVMLGQRQRRCNVRDGDPYYTNIASTSRVSQEVKVIIEVIVLY